MNYKIYLDQIQDLTNQMDEAIKEKDVELFDQLLDTRLDIIEEAEEYAIENNDNVDALLTKIKRIIG
jgi:hypothetical protein|nr:MAG TPA: Flagellar protein [Caudoviricetes sp.]